MGGRPGEWDRAAGPNHGPAPAAPLRREDRYLSLALDLWRPLGARWTLTLSAEGGRYRSNAPDTTRSYLSLRTALRRAF